MQCVGVLSSISFFFFNPISNFKTGFKCIDVVTDKVKPELRSSLCQSREVGVSLTFLYWSGLVDSSAGSILFLLLNNDKEEGFNSLSAHS